MGNLNVHVGAPTICRSACIGQCEYVDVGFMQPKRVCRRCDSVEPDKNQVAPRDLPVMMLPPNDIKYVRLPLQRGFTEVAVLYDLARQYDAVIAGGYAARCCSPWNCEHVWLNSARTNHDFERKYRDIDLFPADNAKASKLVEALREIKFALDLETDYSYTLSPPLLKGASPMLTRWGNVPHSVQVVKTGSIGDGWVGVKNPDGWEDLARQVLSTFDMTVARAAIISEREAIADTRFWDHEGNRLIYMEGFRCPGRLFGRIAKYMAKGYTVDKRQVNNLCAKAAAESTSATLLYSVANKILEEFAKLSKAHTFRMDAGRIVHFELKKAGLQAWSKEDERPDERDSGA